MEGEGGWGGYGCGYGLHCSFVEEGVGVAGNVFLNLPYIDSCLF